MSKIKTMIGVIRTIKNWPIYFADYFKLINRKHIVYILRNGIEYKVRPKTHDSGIIKEIWINNDYTPKGYAINEEDLIIDIGAHIGIFSIFASKFAKEGKIYAFEPIPENFEMLKHNIEINQIKNIIPINKAISDKKGQKEIFLSKDTGGHSFYSFYCGGDRTKAINIQTISLKDIIEENDISQIDFLKVDCEGEEYTILFSCPDKILKTIRKISAECHNINNNRHIFSLKKFLKEKGFEVKIKSDSNMEGTLYANR